MVDSPGNPCFKVFQKEQTCCTDTREIFEYILKRGAWSFEEAKNTYTLSSFYSIFLKEADTDVRNYLTNNLLDMQKRSTGLPLPHIPPALDLVAGDHDYNINDGKFTAAYATTASEILDVLRDVEEQDVLKLKGDIEKNNTISKCWQQMNNFRNNAVCLRCSGSVNSYYDWTTKEYKVDRQMCHTLLDNCHEIWSYMANATWAGDLLHRFKKYSGKGHDTRVSTTGLSKENLHLLWECQNNVTICKEDNTKLDAACKLFTISQSNQDIEGSSILFESATSVLNNIREGVAINNFIADGGNGALRRRNLQNWNQVTTDAGGYVLPVDGVIGADLIGQYNLGFAFAIDLPQTTFGRIFEFKTMMLGFFYLMVRLGW